jgi:hypothetical protein
MRMKQFKIKCMLWAGVHTLWRHIVPLEVYLGLNNTFIVGCSMSMLASDELKHIILDWIADLSCT